MRIVALITLLAFTQVACVGSSYQPKLSANAKLLYAGRNASVVVNDQSARVSPFSADYVRLLDKEAQPVADSGHSQRVAGFIVSMVGLATSVASLVLLANADDSFTWESTSGKIYWSALLGSVLIGGVGGYLNSSADVKLNDAINIHNDAQLAQRLDVSPEALRAASAPQP